MPDSFYRYNFEGNSGNCLVYLPYDLENYIETWSSLREKMIRNSNLDFTRDEWAYLISFLDKEHLLSLFNKNFGELKTVEDIPNDRVALFYPRGDISIWLPNNVSLLGPLNLILASLTGQFIRLKAGSKGRNLTTSFIEYILAMIPECELKEYLSNKVQCLQFDRDDRRNYEISELAKVRVIYGSDETAKSIEKLPSRADSLCFKFIDKYSEIWLSHSEITPDIISQIIKVFNIYGQLGCTSPKKVVLIDGTEAQVKELQQSILSSWNKVISQQEEIPMHIASKNILAFQLSKAKGYVADIVEGNKSVVAYSKLDNIPTIKSDMFLPIETKTLNEALLSLPENIQTIGCAINENTKSALLFNIAKTGIVRIVPIYQMHHFSDVWDGLEFWKQYFLQVEYND